MKPSVPLIPKTENANRKEMIAAGFVIATAKEERNIFKGNIAKDV